MCEHSQWPHLPPTEHPEALLGVELSFRCHTLCPFTSTHVVVSTIALNPHGRTFSSWPEDWNLRQTLTLSFELRGHCFILFIYFFFSIFLNKLPVPQLTFFFFFKAYLNSSLEIRLIACSNSDFTKWPESLSCLFLLIFTIPLHDFSPTLSVCLQPHFLAPPCFCHRAAR